MASAAALFDRQQLKSREDMLALGQILNDTMQQYIEREGDKFDPMTIEKMEASTVEVFRQIKQFVGYNEEDELGDGGSPQLPLLSPPPCDPKIDALEEKVKVASERIAKLRAEMQHAVQETVQKKIFEKLPTATEDFGEEPPRLEVADNSQADLDSGALREKLANASARMPELRAKLEDVYGKLNKLLDSMDEKEDVNAEPPNTAERAMKRLYDDDKGDDDQLTQDVSLAP